MKTLEMDEDTAEKICKNISYAFPGMKLTYDEEYLPEIRMNRYYMGGINKNSVLGIRSFKDLLILSIHNISYNNKHFHFNLEQALMNIDLRSL